MTAQSTMAWRLRQYWHGLLTLVVLLSTLGWAAMGAGTRVARAAVTTGTAWAWGLDDAGQLGDGTAGSPSEMPTPRAVAGAGDIIAIAANGKHSLALKSDHTVIAWGNDAQGQLGDGTIGMPSNDPTPKAVVGLSGIAAIAAGGSHSLALTTNGAVFAWGSNTSGELGNGTAGTDNPTPTAVTGLSSITAIAAGYGYSLALQSDGTILAWGDDLYGQLGDGAAGNPVKNPTPRAIPGVVATAIVAGESHNLALTGSGTVLAWGIDSNGQLGDGTVSNPVSRATPTTVPGLSGIRAVAAGRTHSLALKSDGSILAWGNNFSGQLGSGTSGPIVATPTAVAGVGGITAVAAGSEYSLALKGDGTLLAWGSDNGGQLGDGTINDPSSNPTPKAVPGIGGVTAIAAGYYHALALVSTPCGQMFGDVAAGNPACQAIEGLAARGVIKGCDPTATPPLFCPNDSTLRHQMAALIVRAIPAWVGETGLPTFGDNTADNELMTRVATLQRHGVVRGYQADVCAERTIQTPPGCYGPLDTVKYGQVMLFIARAMEKAGYWTLQPDDRTVFPDQNGAANADPNTDQQTLDHRAVVTYVHYVGNPPDVVDVHAPFALANGQGWNDASTRSWFTRAFWPAIKDH